MGDLSDGDLLVANDVDAARQTDAGDGILLHIELAKQTAIDAVNVDIGAGTYGCDADSTLTAFRPSSVAMFSVNSATSEPSAAILAWLNWMG